MRYPKSITRPVTFLALFSCFGAIGQAQNGIDPNRLANIRARLSNVKTLLEGLPSVPRRQLSSGAQNLLKLAQGWDEAEGSLKNASPAAIQASKTPVSASIPFAAPQAGLAFVSNPGTDFLFSILAGFTQSETSTAWCGNNVVVGFNDSGSFFESLLLGPGGLSFSGAGISSNQGASFRDIGFINPGPDPNNFLVGDPVVSCALVPSLEFGPQRLTPIFFYTQLFETGPANAPVTAIALSKSTNSGATWADPVAAVKKDGITHFLDKDWSAVDPTNSSNIFVTYTDFDMSGDAPCGFAAPGVPNLRTAIELVRSTDGGATWTAPSVIVQACNTPPQFPAVQGSQVIVDSQGSVYIAWEDFSDPTGLTRDLRIRKSTNHGVSFAPAVLISPVTYTGDGNGVQGGIRNNEFPLLAVDRTGTKSDGTLYVTWNDGRNFQAADLEAGKGLYGYADVLLSHSADGSSWTAPIRVNSDPIFHLVQGHVRGTDHFQPGVAIDRNGALGLCWYDRRFDPNNFLISRVCALSTNGGGSFTTFAFAANWQPWHAVDVFINPFYLGDYDFVASDFTRANAGFLGAFGNVTTTNVLVPNQDVIMFKFTP